MQFYVGTKLYSFKYYPFFVKEKKKDYHIYGMRLPNGDITEVFVFDTDNPISALREYSSHLITEYVLEDDDMLTPNAMKLKSQLKELLE